MKNLVQFVKRAVWDRLKLSALKDEFERLEKEIHALQQRVDYASHYDYPAFVNTPYHLHNIELTNHCPMSCCMCPRPHHMLDLLDIWI
jgi:MoaA/NifB/PqqE/SkfB family radical SAM enzyme